MGLLKCSGPQQRTPQNSADKLLHPRPVQALRTETRSTQNAKAEGLGRSVRVGG